ncbi:chemotaxis protein MotB [Cohaesibacter marisflavi]|uniref:Chemotaxis protein MotB n=1 Tax=Cohaesibacter marisflavi TaxID=655353 RepID=A0A1I5HN80_9HYPH|nr:flagellar motor protein MotB [Cohaesibacter marisflavi]SFO49778.1 chemotaxis protein MotB [Cohaesibacter marisflavi]
MAKKKPQGGGGAPDWLVTFSDLMSLLVCFFVLIISFSIQDNEKLQVVAGSMKDAFGVKPVMRKAGMIEIEGMPVRQYIKEVAAVPQENDSDYSQERHDQRTKQGPEANTHDIEKTEIEKPRMFATAAASLRQAWQELPEISELSKHIIIEEQEDGLNIQLVDQDGRSMFAEGSKFPYDFTRRLIVAMAPVLANMPNRIKITGHTTASNVPVNTGYTGWELSADRANAVRSILMEHGLPADQIFGVVGKADSEPLFPNDPYLAANRRISILLMSEAPPLPPTHQP